MHPAPCSYSPSRISANRTRDLVHQVHQGKQHRDATLLRGLHQLLMNRTGHHPPRRYSASRPRPRPARRGYPDVRSPPRDPPVAAGLDARGRHRNATTVSAPVADCPVRKNNGTAADDCAGFSSNARACSVCSMALVPAALTSTSSRAGLMTASRETASWSGTVISTSNRCCGAGAAVTAGTTQPSQAMATSKSTLCL